MLTRIRKAQGSERAFTLIELIVVIIIIGILAAIGVAAYTSLIGSSKGSATDTTATQFDRNFRTQATLDSAKSSSGDPRVSKETLNADLPNSGYHALQTAYAESNLKSNGYTACFDNSTPATTPPALSSCTTTAQIVPTTSGTITLTQGTVDKADYRFVILIKAGKATCLTLGTKSNEPGQIVSDNQGAATKCATPTDTTR